MTPEEFWSAFDGLVAKLRADNRTDVLAIIEGPARSNSGLTDGWSDLRQALSLAASRDDLSERERASLRVLERAANDFVLRR